MEIPRTLVVTNEFPPRIGGIQRFVHALVAELPPDRITVLAPAWQGAATFDAKEPYEVLRASRRFLWPTPGLARHVGEVARARGSEVVLFGAPLPLGVMGPRLARGGLPYLSLAHGFDFWLSLVSGPHAVLRWAMSRSSGVLVCSEAIARVVRTAVLEVVPVAVLSPGADPDRFRPDLDGSGVRAALGIGDRPLVVCVSRLVPRKGQDVLIRGMPRIRERVPDAALLLVGGGPARRRLEELSREAPPASVFFAGEVDDDALPAHYAAGDVFAMPCRTRRGGLELEGWGAVFVEAAACGKPVVVGDSGGARESLVDGVTGLLVDGTDVVAVADAVTELLGDPERAAAMGKAGRERVEREMTWGRAADRLAAWLRAAA